MLVALAGPSSVAAQTVTAFASTPVFNSGGLALAVFNGGDLERLEGAARAAAASGVWAQDPSGGHRLLVVDGPSFLREPFASAFPDGFPDTVAITLVRPTAEAAPPAPPSAAPDTFTAEVAALTADESDARRAAAGHPGLRRDARLDAAAEAYARVVLDRDPYLRSESPHTLDGEPWDRATNAGYAWGGMAENLGMASAFRSTPEAATVAETMAEMWLDSPPHRENLLSPDYTETGVGCAAGTPASPSPSGSTPDLLVICVAMYAAPE
ncbi:MAG: CAP domain-containing protein [Dehalococcoidia bacterium]